MTRTTSTRREFCVGALRAGATAAVAGAWSPLLSPRAVSAAQRVFRHGVASGDPLADRVILWTRVSTDGGEPLTTHSEWYFVDTVLERSRNEHLGAAYEVRSGTAHLVSTHTSVK